MVVDSSAIIAILFGEPESDRFSKLILQADKRLLSAVNHFEASIVADAASKSRDGPTIDDLFAALSLQIVPVAEVDSGIARIAYQRFGKGNHPARLNMGDCFAYALAKLSGEPLLFKGTDFLQTDVKSVT
jgi:ribonuclease VapC